jgi:selenocysteine-specific translation elongation factor
VDLLNGFLLLENTHMINSIVCSALLQLAQLQAEVLPSAGAAVCCFLYEVSHLQVPSQPKYCFLHTDADTHCACLPACSVFLLQLAQLQAEVVAKQAMLGDMCSQLSATQQQLAAFDDTSSAALQQLQQQLAEATAARQDLQMQLEQQQQLAEATAPTDTLQAQQQQQQQQQQGLDAVAAFTEQQPGSPLSTRSPFSSREPRPASGTPAGSRQELAQLVGEF